MHAGNDLSHSHSLPSGATIPVPSYVTRVCLYYLHWAVFIPSTLHSHAAMYYVLCTQVLVRLCCSRKGYIY